MALIVHAVMYRDYQLGTLCNSGAWGLPEHYSAITERVTCPGCRDKLDGAGAPAASAELLLAQVRDFHDNWGETDSDDLDPLDLWERLGEILALDPTAAPASQHQGAAVDTVFCRDCDGFGDITIDGLTGQCASCDGKGSLTPDELRRLIGPGRA